MEERGASGAVDERSGRRLASSTAIFSLATGLSRILGLLRESVASYYFGAAGRINAFTVAFQIPNLVRALVADAALSGAFVPIFSELLEKGERKRAWRVASTLFWLMLLGLGALTALFMLLAPLLMRPFDPVDPGLTVGLSRVLFPIVALLGVSGIVVGILNSYEHFSVPALTPVFWNLAIILGLVLGVPAADGESAELYVYAASIVVGTVIQLLLPVPWLRGRDDRLRLAIDVRDPAVKRVLALMVPVTLGLGLINVNAVVGTFFASRYIDPNLAPRAIDAAFRLYMLPQGIFSVAIATVLFPALARLAARDDVEGFRGTVNLGLRQIAFFLIPASAVSAVLAEPITRIVYERGAFDPSETREVAAALAAFAGGLTFNGAMLMLTRAFFSLQSNWLPTLVALGNVVVNAVLNVYLFRVGIWGIPLATSIVNVAGTVVLLALLSRRLGGIEIRRSLRAVRRIVAASVVLSAVAYAVWDTLDHLLGRSFAAQFASLGAALLAGSLVYVVFARLLGIREVDALLSLRSRLGRR